MSGLHILNFPLFLLLTISQISIAQIQFETWLGALPGIINESSGIDIDRQGNIWTHNDSGDQPRIFRISPTGQLLQTIQITGASHVDWEDITISSDNRLFIADIGNNNNDRQNLRIYIVDLNQWNAQINQLPAQVISFSYPDQAAFPPPAAQRNFDAEAIAWYENKLYIFTKNRTSPSDGFTRCYQLPDQPGQYFATYIDRFFTSTNDSEGRITAADIDFENGTLALMSMTKMWVFSIGSMQAPFAQLDFQQSFSTFTQKEALCFQQDCDALITDEYIQAFNIGGQLMKASWCQSISVNDNFVLSKPLVVCIQEGWKVELPDNMHLKNGTVYLLGMDAKTIKQLRIEEKTFIVQYPESQLPGCYILLITNVKGERVFSAIVQKP